jgi:hypothetical protein
MFDISTRSTYLVAEIVPAVFFKAHFAIITLSTIIWSSYLNERFRYVPTGWSKSHATHIKIFIDGSKQYNSIGWKALNIAVTVQEPTQVTSCRNQLAPVRQLSFSIRSAMMSFSQVQRVFIVEHYLALVMGPTWSLAEVSSHTFVPQKESFTENRPIHSSSAPHS